MKPLSIKSTSAIYLSLIHLVFTSILLISIGHADTMYKWVDEDGNVHYSNTPNPEVKQPVIKLFEYEPPSDDEVQARERQSERYRREHEENLDTERAEKRIEESYRTNRYSDPPSTQDDLYRDNDEAIKNIDKEIRRIKSMHSGVGPGFEISPRRQQDLINDLINQKSSIQSGTSIPKANRQESERIRMYRGVTNSKTNEYCPRSGRGYFCPRSSVFVPATVGGASGKSGFYPGVGEPIDIDN